MVNMYTKANKMQRVIARCAAILLVLNSKSYITTCPFCGARHLYVVDNMYSVCISCFVFTN